MFSMNAALSSFVSLPLTFAWSEPMVISILTASPVLRFLARNRHNSVFSVPLDRRTEVFGNESCGEHCAVVSDYRSYVVCLLDAEYESRLFTDCEDYLVCGVRRLLPCGVECEVLCYFLREVVFRRKLFIGVPAAEYEAVLLGSGRLFYESTLGNRLREYCACAVRLKFDGVAADGRGSVSGT